ncbi:conserved exported protein of unknown function [Candidatus Nitrospira inopinata]|jgi:hypothetical protein|uniref:Uncharacterized protein n=2 Tax=Candidatus Nitrospira inopinata TaxID=1715989 RepID=A0A0S4KTU1_9BACT|nr:conserved exported protein of unknown function [Candidatus Nitrospira inopinata]
MSMLKIIIVGLLAVVAIAAAVVYGALNWADGTRQLRARIENACMPITPKVVNFHELAGLPEPVQQYFRAVLKEGRPMVAGVRVRHQGTFNMGETADQWRPFTSDQRVITRRPGFDWDGRIKMMPGLTVRVHDAYVAGEGILYAALLGLIPLVDLRGAGDVAEGELMRFFAEAAWYPTALLPSQGVRWEPLDARSARAMLTDGAITVTMLFGFNGAGGIETVRVEARGRTIGKKVIPTPWQGRFWNYQERGGMQVPLEGEVAWLLPEGTKPYWRGRITEIEYEFAK